MAASSMIGRAFIQVAMDASKVPSELKKTQTTVKCGLTDITKSAKAGMGSLTSYFSKLQGILQGVLAGGAAASSVASFASYADKIYKTATRLNVDPQFISQWEYLERSFGLASGSIDTMAQKLNVLGKKANEGSKEALDTLEKMGLSAKEFSELPMEQKIEALVKAVSGASTEAERQAIAIGAIGKGAGNLMYLLAGGVDKYKKQMENGFWLDQ